MAEPTGAAPEDGRRPVPDVPPPPPGVWPLAPSSGRGGAPGPDGRPLLHAAAVLPRAAAGIGLSVAAIAVYLGGQVVLSLVAGLLLVLGGLVDPDQLDPDAGGTVLLAVAVLSQIAGIGAVLLLLRLRRVPLRHVTGRVRPVLRTVGVGAGIGVLTVIATTVVVTVLVTLSGSEDAPDQVLTRDIAEGGATLVLAAVAAVVIAPLIEELLFRGLLHRGLRARMRVVPATAISSLAFALIHVEVLFSQPVALVGLTIAGAVMAVAYERTGGLLMPVVIHATYNAVTIVAVVVAGRLEDLLPPGTLVTTLLGPVAGALVRSVGA